MARLAVISYHTSPLAQPGTGDGGGMNVYVRELSSALARLGNEVDVYTRRDNPFVLDTVNVEPGFRVHNISAGPPSVLGRNELPPTMLQPSFGKQKFLTRFTRITG